MLQLREIDSGRATWPLHSSDSVLLSSDSDSDSTASVHRFLPSSRSGTRSSAAAAATRRSCCRCSRRCRRGVVERHVEELLQELLLIL